MKHVHVFVFLMFFHLGNCVKILGFFTTPSYSHQQTFQTLCKELAIRGHEVTFISPEILNDESIKKLKGIDIHQTYDLKKKYSVGRFLSKDVFTFERVLGYFLLSGVPTEIAFADEEVIELIKSGEEYDLLILQGMHPLTFAMAAKFKAPIIGKFACKYFFSLKTKM